MIEMISDEIFKYVLPIKPQFFNILVAPNELINRFKLGILMH